MENYLTLDKLKTYKLAVNLSEIAWKIFENLNFQLKKILGYQFVQATESIAANIAEGFGRFHYLDKVKFYYNSRGSLLESRHWFDRIIKKTKIDKKIAKEIFLKIIKKLD